MDKTRPIRIFWQDGVSIKQIIFVSGVIIKVLKLAGMDKKIAVKRGGNISHLIVCRKNMDIKSEFFGKYDAGEIIDDISLRQRLDNYDKYYAIFLIKNEIFMSVRKGKKLLGGLAMDSSGFVMEVGDRFPSNHHYITRSFIHNTVMHELGHVFGLPSDERKKRIKLCSINQAKHCANDCVMSTNNQVFPIYEKFCSTCLRELCEYFE